MNIIRSVTLDCWILKRRYILLVLSLILLLICFVLGRQFLSRQCGPSLASCNLCSNWRKPSISSPSPVSALASKSSVGYIVPNVVHFIWFHNATVKMSFFNYISIRSAHQVHQPDQIMLHCSNLPVGEWWDRLWREVPLKIVHKQPPEFIFGQKISHVFHQGDVAKLEILLEHGGIYLDYDVIVVNSLNPLRQYPVTYGKEKPPKLIAGIIAGQRNATFLRMVYEAYRENYKPDRWDYNCAQVSYELAQKHPDLVHIEQRKLTTPDYLDRHLLFKEVINWSDLYVIHLMIQSHEWNWNPDTIKTMKSTLGEVLRYIYYGSPVMLHPQVTQIAPVTPSTVLP